MQSRVMQTRAARESRVRRAAARQGLTLQKSRRHAPETSDRDRYRLLNAYTNYVVHGTGDSGSSLEAIEGYLALDE